MAYKQYEPEELRRLQLASTKILKEFDRVCDVLGTPYFIYAGTAIGAVRHGGFIPWDDDIDVGMFRPDYERFLEEAPAVVGDDFVVVNGRTDPFFPACNSNLALKNTLCVPEEFSSCPFQYPIGIGVYAFDKVSEDSRTRRKQMRGTWLWARLAFLRATPSPQLFIKGWRRTLVSAACHVAYGAMRLFHVSPAWIHRHWERSARRAEGEQTETWADFTDQAPLDWSLTHDDVFPLQNVAFEGLVVKLPRENDKLLRRGYGDYMELPPKDERKNHYPSKLDFGEYA
jgi:lipopolysaccharide cholinephosphotransferase